MGVVYYVCPLCGQEFALKTRRQKSVKCGDHTLQVTESEGILTVQVKTKLKENVLKGAK